MESPEKLDSESLVSGQNLVAAYVNYNQLLSRSASEVLPADVGFQTIDTLGLTRDTLPLVSREQLASIGERLLEACFDSQRSEAAEDAAYAAEDTLYELVQSLLNRQVMVRTIDDQLITVFKWGYSRDDQRHRYLQHGQVSEIRSVISPRAFRASTPRILWLPGNKERFHKKPPYYSVEVVNDELQPQVEIITS